MPALHSLACVIGAHCLLATAVWACDACNLSFADQVTSGVRKESAIGADLRRTMTNQVGLPLGGLVDANLVAMQNAKLSPGGGGGAVTATSSGSAAPDVTTRRATVPGLSAVSNTHPGIASPIRQHGGRPLPDYMQGADFIDVLERDYALATTPYSTVPQSAPADKSFTIKLNEGMTYLGNGVVYDGFLMDGKIPGPTIIVNEGDVVEMTFENTGSIPHGASIHSAYTQTSKYVGKIGPKSSASVRFRAMMPGVYMYHCAPGGHAIPMHVLAGQYGMMLVRPKPGSYQLEKEMGHAPDLELFILQHEIYASGKDAIAGDVAYTMFNGRLFRYVEEPIITRPGDYVRINYLNVGPNLFSTFHIVGIIWDYVYWQGNPAVQWPGGQTVTAGPSDSFVIEFRMPPDEGAYTMLNHAVGATSRGAIGLLVVDGQANPEPNRVILADGPSYNRAEMAGYLAGATRVVAPFKLGTHPVDKPVVFGPETKEVHISIIGNSFWPKAVQIAPGTTVTWTNEDVFTYLGGEYAGIHNVVSLNPPENSDGFNSPLLAHGETYSLVFDQEWNYEYNCMPHPYMRGHIIVKEPEYALANTHDSVANARLGGGTLALLGLCLLVSTAALTRRSKSQS
jgi:nitrite reductase (NO-forming)